MAEYTKAGKSPSGIAVDDLRAIEPNDLRAAMRQVRASVSQQDLAGYIEWDKTYGSYQQDSAEEVSP